MTKQEMIYEIVKKYMSMYARRTKYNTEENIAIVCKNIYYTHKKVEIEKIYNKYKTNRYDVATIYFELCSEK